MNRDVYGYIAIFSLISIFGIFIAGLIYGVNNDYILWELNNVAEDIEETGLIDQETVDNIESVSESHQAIGDFFDWGWLLFHILFVGSTITICYFAKEETEFGFLGMLFYGVMVLLFILTIVDVLTNWFITDVVYSVMPYLNGVMPMFDYYQANIGLISFIHLLACFFANKIKLSGLGSKNDMENEII
jgi:hypothetical protein